MTFSKPLFTALMLLLSVMAQAHEYRLNVDSSIVGENLQVRIPANSKRPLEYYAAKYQTGLSNLLEANPDVDPFLPSPGQLITVPQQLILPPGERRGIVINSAEMRLYFYPPGQGTVVIMPVGIGEVDRETPLEWKTTVLRKKKYPQWVPTPRIRADYLAQGIALPAVFPAGPDNPMGLYSLYVGRLYAIHGTNASFGIGLRVSHGCIRLRNNDIKYLYEHVPEGTSVRFINEPVKFAKTNQGVKYLEVHQPLSRTQSEWLSEQKPSLKIRLPIRDELKSADINKNIMEEALKQRTGLIVKIN